MKLNQLIESVVTDQEYLTLAEKYWETFKEEINGHVVLLGLDEFESFEESFAGMLKKLMKYNFNLTYRDIPVTVNLMPTEGNHGVRGRLRTTSIEHGNSHTDYKYSIELYFNLSSDLDLISINDFYNTFNEAFERVFIHEFVHFLDDYRSHDKKKYIDTKRKLRQKGEYINTPHEYNAFYMQMLSELKRAFNSKEVIELFKDNSDFKSFQSIVRMDTESGQILSDLSGKFLRSYQKRLFQLYKTYYSKYIA